MSQKKVDAYKEEKANRQKIMKKEKRILMLEKLAGLALCIAAVGWIGFSVYSKATEDKVTEVQETILDTAALDNYVSSLSADEAE